MSYKNIIFKHRNGNLLENNSNFYETDNIYLSSIGQRKKIMRKKLPCIIYSIKDQEDFNLFGYLFIEKNKDKCYIVYDNKKYKIDDSIDFLIDNNQKLKIKLLILDDLINLSYMFSSCSCLESVSNFSNIKTSKITDISYMFYECSSLKKVSDISNWNTINVVNMSNMFSWCEALISLPDISKWDTSNVVDMNSLFLNCSSLYAFPDISKWNTNNVTDLSNLFSGCKSLIGSSDLSNWNTSNVTNMSSMFYNCTSLSSLPNITKWDTSNVTNMSSMFCKCYSLEALTDDILNYSTEKLGRKFNELESLVGQYVMTGFSKDFEKLDLLKNVGDELFSDDSDNENDKFNWNLNKVTDISCMFYGCNSLKSLPDISKWNIGNVTNMSELFSNCSSLTSLPDISKWNTINQLCCE